MKILKLLLLFFSPMFCAAQENSHVLDRKINRALQTFNIPGVSISVVKDGKVILVKGYGVKEMGKVAPVDSTTSFGIASNSKSFTAVALALLAEDGKLSWDDPVIRHLPWFRLSDPYITQNMKVRDIVSHNTGLASGAGELMIFPPSVYTARQIAERMQNVPVQYTFRERYSYNNSMFVVAGLLVEEVSGMGWEEFIQTRILNKLGMNDSSPRISDLAKRANAFTAHLRIGGKPVPAHEYPNFQMSDAGNACGGIISTARDMTKWLKMLLDSGRIDKQRLFKAQTLSHLWTIVTPAGKISQPGYLAPVSSDYWGYGHGFNMNKFRDYDYVGHGGGLYGLLSRMGFIPSQKLAVFVNTNAHSGYGRDAIFYTVVDHFLGIESFDWISAYKRREDETGKTLENNITRMHDMRDSTIRPSSDLKNFAGTYHDKWYGDIHIVLDNNRLCLKSDVTPVYDGVLNHWQGDTFTVHWNKPHIVFSDLFVTFEINPYGRVTEMKLLSRPGTGRRYQDLEMIKVR